MLVRREKKKVFLFRKNAMVYGVFWSFGLRKSRKAHLSTPWNTCVRTRRPQLRQPREACVPLAKEENPQLAGFTTMRHHAANIRKDGNAAGRVESNASKSTLFDLVRSNRPRPDVTPLDLAGPRWTSGEFQRIGIRDAHQAFVNTRWFELTLGVRNPGEPESRIHVAEARNRRKKRASSLSIAAGCTIDVLEADAREIMIDPTTRRQRQWRSDKDISAELGFYKDMSLTEWTIEVILVQERTFRENNGIQK
ncbi:hypothetical protein FPV67DRAFT_1652370 [Lyophyllum atratum]|nr:hypothetical protein FPV67DRAFT_1652370 [Lyophyllum atratum]